MLTGFVTSKIECLESYLANNQLILVYETVGMHEIRYHKRL